MTAEYIGRSSLVARMKYYEEHTTEESGEHYAYSVALREIRNAPAADVAKVVRCKNCKWFADNNGGEWYGCKMFHVVRITPDDAPKPDDFCRYGERKEGPPCEL